MMPNSELIELLNEMSDGQAILYDGLNEAVVAIAEVWAMAEGGGGQRVSVAVYDYMKLIEIFTREDDMTEEDAIEHIDYNILGGYLGTYTPVFVNLNGELSQ
jgi:hypothetical protein